MPFNVGPLELIIVLALVLLVVGPRRLPEMGNAIGKTLREFRQASSDVTEAATLEPAAKAEPSPPQAGAAATTTPTTAPVPASPETAPPAPAGDSVAETTAESDAPAPAAEPKTDE